MKDQRGGVIPVVAAGCVPCAAAAGSAIPSISTMLGVGAVTCAGTAASMKIRGGKKKKTGKQKKTGKPKKTGKQKKASKQKKTGKQKTGKSQSGSGRHKQDWEKRQKGGGKNMLTKLQIKNSQRFKKCEKTAKNKYQKKKCLDEFNKTWTDYSRFLKKNAIRGGPRYADRKQYTPKQQREIMKRFFGKNQKGGKE
jgi:hypothetical protein